MLIKQLSDSDTVVLEVTLDNARIFLASMYLDLNQQIDDECMYLCMYVFLINLFPACSIN